MYIRLKWLHQLFALTSWLLVRVVIFRHGVVFNIVSLYEAGVYYKLSNQWVVAFSHSWINVTS